MLGAPTPLLRAILPGRKRPLTWRQTKSTTKKNADKFGTSISLDEASLGIYSIRIGKRKLPLLGVEVGRIPLWEPGSQKKKAPESSRTDITVHDENALSTPKAPKTYVDRLSVTGLSNPIGAQLASATGGLTFDPNEHPLLCDLDETRDAVMYGRGREFVENVKRVRSLLVGFHKWEITERWYRWATIFFKLMVVFYVYVAWYQIRVSTLLMSSHDLYTENHEKTLREQDEKRLVALQNAFDIALETVSTAEIVPKEISDGQTRIRRELLPDSSDLMSIVKARMKEYHEEKHHAKVFPV
mmetsp:Transcript_2542/g.3931  ORF Transcript_2542/g.3931 Transcript_2542/m.3931 type:complete len:299 (-) Transcript_2542:49-945(-)